MKTVTGWTGFLLLVSWTGFAAGYIDLPPATLGRLCASSMNVTLLRVEKLDRERRAVVFRAVRDLKGNSPSDFYRLAAGSDKALGEALLKGAGGGKTALFFGSAARNAGYVYVNDRWYLWTAPGGSAKWWRPVREEPGLLRGYAGPADRLEAAVKDLLAGKEVVVAARAPAKTGEEGPARLMNLRASLKRLDYDPGRDLVREKN